MLDGNMDARLRGHDGYSQTNPIIAPSFPRRREPMFPQHPAPNVRRAPGKQVINRFRRIFNKWMPACAGMTESDASTQ
jgi:hypothetical protein